MLHRHQLPILARQSAHTPHPHLTPTKLSKNRLIYPAKKRPLHKLNCLAYIQRGCVAAARRADKDPPPY